MTENAGDYEQIVETIHLQDRTIRKVGFRAGKWIVETRHEKVAISQDGYLLYIELSLSGRAHSYDLFSEFDEMVADKKVDFLLLGKVAAAIDADYIAYLDD